VSLTCHPPFFIDLPGSGVTGCKRGHMFPSSTGTTKPSERVSVGRLELPRPRPDLRYQRPPRAAFHLSHTRAAITSVCQNIRRHNLTRLSDRRKLAGEPAQGVNAAQSFGSSRTYDLHRVPLFGNEHDPVAALEVREAVDLCSFTVWQFAPRNEAQRQ
jgi:hypothetical protein